MGTAKALVAEALKHDGYLETPTNHTKFGRWFGWDGVAWCHIFVSYCAAHSGNGNVIPHTAGCATGVDWFRDRGQFFRRGEKTPREGDIVYYGPTGGDHVGIVVSVSGGKIHTIEGNTSNSSGYNPNGGGVHRKEWPLSYSRIYGYGRPAYVASKGSDMPDIYVSLGSDRWVGKPKKGSSVYLAFDREFADGAGQHGNKGAYPTVLVTPSLYTLTVGVTVSGLPKDGSCWIRAVEVYDKKASNGSFPIRETDATQTILGKPDGGPVYVTYTNTDTLGKSRRLRLQMGGFSHEGVQVKPTSLKILAWKQ